MTRLGDLRVEATPVADAFERGESEPRPFTDAPSGGAVKARPAHWWSWRAADRESIRERDLSLLREIEAEIESVSPQFSQVTKSLRQFAGRYLSSETPHEALLGIVSPRQGEGRTTIAVGLAGALAEVYGSVVLVEMETEQVSPTLCTELNLGVTFGLRDYLEDRASLQEILLATSKDNFFLLPAGPVLQQFSRLDATARTRELLATLKQLFEVVVVDLPPALVSEETPALLPDFDGFVLVANAGSTTTDDVQRTIELCGPIPLRGVLLNQVRLRAPRWLASLLNH